MFLPDSNQVTSRDYLSVKLWDLRVMRPLHSAQIMENQDRSLRKLEEEDALDDEFFTTLSPDGKHLVTGGYN